jgi:TolB protein
MLQNTKIAYVFDGNIYTMTPYGTDQTQSTYYNHGERSADELSWSPDGKKIAFDAVSNGQWNIFILDISTKEIQPLVQTLEEEGGPSWSSDGKYIYYSANRDGNQDIYRISPSGGTEERMTEYPSSEYDPAISADGKKILFVSNMNGNWDVYRLVLSDGNLLRVLRDEGTHINPRWRPGHNQITYFTIGGSFSIDNFFWVDSNSLKSDFTNGWGSGNNPQYDWSPDGSMLVKSEQSLCIYGIDFQEITGLACGIDGAIRPAWSPILKQ